MYGNTVQGFPLNANQDRETLDNAIKKLTPPGRTTWDYSSQFQEALNTVFLRKYLQLADIYEKVK